MPTLTHRAIHKEVREAVEDACQQTGALKRGLH